MNSNNQMALFAYSGEETTLAAGISRWQTAEKRKDGKTDGELMGVALTLGKRRDLAKSLGLEGKANIARLDKAILDMTDDALTGMKAELAALSTDDFTAHHTPITVKRLKDGRTVRTYKVISVERDDRIDEEELAKALGVPVEVVHKMRMDKAAKEALEAKNTVEVKAEVTPAPDGQPDPEAPQTDAPQADPIPDAPAEAAPGSPEPEQAESPEQPASVQEMSDEELDRATAPATA
jgi:hypothetical protein